MLVGSGSESEALWPWAQDFLALPAWESSRLWGISCCPLTSTLLPMNGFPLPFGKRCYLSSGLLTVVFLILAPPVWERARRTNEKAVGGGRRSIGQDSGNGSPWCEGLCKDGRLLVWGPAGVHQETPRRSSRLWPQIPSTVSSFGIQRASQAAGGQGISPGCSH